MGRMLLKNYLNLMRVLSSRLIHCNCGGKAIKIAKIITNLSLMLYIIVVVSCAGNDISICIENKSIYSSHEIKNLYIEMKNDSYFITCKQGYRGDKCIKLDSIPCKYELENADKSILKIERFRKGKKSYNFLRRNDFYTITNLSNGDAGGSKIIFSTDSDMQIKVSDVVN